MQYHKPKSVAKLMYSRGTELQRVILSTLKKCSDIVGATLGPGGMPVLIERQDVGLPPMVTKDGVTVFKNLGFVDATSQIVMETAREASVRTAAEAGDGTTTATILSEALVRLTMDYCIRNPHQSPQKVVRELQRLFDEVAEPFIRGKSVRASLADDRGRELLFDVATISGNGDEDLASAVMECYDICGDSGNVTISESTGPSKYGVQKIEGYPAPIGYEDSCGPFYQKFVNDPGTQMCLLEKPNIILYHGKISDFNTIYPVLNTIANAVSEGREVGGEKLTHNVVIVATGYSETVLANLAAGFVMEGTLNVFPLLAPLSPVRTGQYDFLADLAALTGARIMDVLEYPLQNFCIDDVGIGISSFESARFRSNFIGFRDELLVLERVDQIQKQLEEVAASELDKTLLRERLAKLTSGIAKLIVVGSSHGEVKEKRDRAEDAICAVRGAIKHGVLPGGGSVLRDLARELEGQPGVASEVLAKALLEPSTRLYLNAGFSQEESSELVGRLTTGQVFDVLNLTWMDPFSADGGVLDSVPAVLEALRTSISIASALGPCGGTIAFPRNGDIDRQEAKDTADFVRNANWNPADERP